MLYRRKEVIGDAELYLGDCLDIMPTLDKVDAVVTDPPYGIGESAAKNNSRGKCAPVTDYGSDNWDSNPASAEHISLMLGVSDHQIIFGGNYFDLPPTKCWLVWDKQNGKNDFADCELAWTNLNKAVRLIIHRWAGMLQQNMKEKEKRYHLTQKPVPVMAWCIRHIPEGSNTILDPFMGSGTTGVAAVQEGRKFIGIEIDEGYFDIACNRIEEAQKQLRLF